MQGQVFGRWTVMGPYEKNRKGERRWLCRCDCGTERYVLERSLRSGGSISCGCQRREKASEALRKTLAGKTFGELTVLHPSPKRHDSGGIWWVCRCSCGAEYECPGTLLATGRRTHCGAGIHRKKRNTVDITGQRFHRLTALYPTQKRGPKGSVVWHCRCDCGSEVDVPYNDLLYTNLVSCGCRKKEHSSTLSEHLTRAADTSIDSLKSRKIPQNNTTGYRGVYFIRGKYVAKINFQKRAYYLGAYDDIVDAAKARQAAQEQLFDEVASFYERWEQRAEADPKWAEENPVRITVEQRDKADFKVVLLPVME